MTAPIGTAANRFTGIREFSQVTNTYGGYLQSGGVAYNITLPFFPDKFEWFNYTKFATDTNNVQGVWFRDFPAGDSLIITRGTTTLTSTLEVTNGVTNASTAAGFTSEHVTITGITTATPAVVTASAHGLANGDRVIITKVIGTMAPEVNNQTFVVAVLSSSTFALYDVHGVPITTVGAYTSSGQITKIGPKLGIINSPQTVILTLGSAIMGADNDKIYFVATQFNNYINLGDIA
jgi:hypothetical protein